MNAMMNKLQLCGAASGPCQSAPMQRSAPQPAPVQPTLPRFDAPRIGPGVAGFIAGTAIAGLAAVVLIVARVGMAEPLPVIELPRVVIEAKRLPAGACPVPVAAGAVCPVPTEAAVPATTTELESSRRTPL